jgi:hypothetical protein
LAEPRTSAVRLGAFTGGSQNIHIVGRSCYLEDSQLDRVVADSVLESDARYRIPGAQTLARRLVLARSYVVRAARSAVGSEISNRGTRTENEKLLLRQCGKSEPVSSSLTVSPEANL